MIFALIPREAKTGKPIPDTHVGCHEVQRMFKLSWHQVDHLLKKFNVPYLRCTQRLRWVDREQFLDAYEAKNRAAKTKDIPQPATNLPTEVTPPKPGPFDDAIKAHLKATQTSTPRYHSEEAEKAFRRRAVPLTPAQEIARWRVEHRAALKRRHDPIVVRVVAAAKKAKPPRKPLNQRQGCWLGTSV
jgi:hypothetical protein